MGGTHRMAADLLRRRPGRRAVHRRGVKPVVPPHWPVCCRCADGPGRLDWMGHDTHAAWPIDPQTDPAVPAPPGRVADQLSATALPPSDPDPPCEGDGTTFPHRSPSYWVAGWQSIGAIR